MRASLSGRIRCPQQGTASRLHNSPSKVCGKLPQHGSQSSCRFRPSQPQTPAGERPCCRTPWSRRQSHCRWEGEGGKQGMVRRSSCCCVSAAAAAAGRQKRQAVQQCRVAHSRQACHAAHARAAAAAQSMSCSPLQPDQAGVAGIVKQLQRFHGVTALSSAGGNC